MNARKAVAVDVFQHVGDEILDRGFPLPEQRQPDALREERIRGVGETGAAVTDGVPEAPVAVGQTLPDDMRGVHVGALPEGRAQRGDQCIGIAGRHDRDAINRRVVDLCRGTGIGARDVEGEDIDLGDAIVLEVRKGFAEALITRTTNLPLYRGDKVRTKTK